MGTYFDREQIADFRIRLLYSFMLGSLLPLPSANMLGPEVDLDWLSSLKPQLVQIQGEDYPLSAVLHAEPTETTRQLSFFSQRSRPPRSVSLKPPLEDMSTEEKVEELQKDYGFGEINFIETSEEGRKNYFLSAIAGLSNHSFRRQVD